MPYSTLELIEIFRDTQAALERDEILAQESCRLRAESRLFLDEYRALYAEKRGTAAVEVVGDTTFHCAKDFARAGKHVAVLNFANPYQPGGGVRAGSAAQEECLCRASNLYAALTVPYFHRHYYKWNERSAGRMGSDRIIFSPGVTVFKEDESYAPLDTPFRADVITCAAPYLAETSFAKIGMDKYCETMRRRIANIIETAKSAQADVLVLGAFGCGAFANPPETVAKLFYEQLIEQDKAAFFERVVFAIKKSGADENLRIFRDVFAAQE